jgi:predicted HTH transcriptional regulator
MSTSVIFISSVQREFAEERRALKAFIEGDALLRRFFTVFLFEDLPASDRRADAVYLSEVDRCAIYVGLLGNEYGSEDAAGVSPTEREFDRATEHGKPRLIFVKGAGDSDRSPKMAALIRKAGSQLIRRRFNGVPELNAALYASLVDHLEASGALQARPFEERPCPDATLDDLNAQAVSQFVRAARYERQFPLPVETPFADVLAHLHLLRGAQPTNAAMLLFGRDPQRFVPCAEVRCMHFHGTEIQRPVPFYRIFKGTLFEQVDMALDFVLSKLNRSVGTRAESVQAPVRYEIPPDVVREAIVNAVAHRDYTSPGAVQVSVFADRVEVWNPGTLLPPLTPESLRHPHGSLLRNPRLCEALFLARYIEKYGTGTLMMIRECAAHALPEPDFAQRGGEFTTAVWRDWLTEATLRKLVLNDRQRSIVAFLRAHAQATNRELQQLTGVTDRTILRDLTDLMAKGVLEKVGITGRATHYIIKRQTRQKPDKPDKMLSPASAQTKPSQTGSEHDEAGVSGRETRRKADKPVSRR